MLERHGTISDILARLTRAASDLNRRRTAPRRTG